MNVTGRDREAARRDPGARNLDGTCIGCAILQHFTLIWDFGFLCRAHHPLNDASVGLHASIFYLDRRAFTQADFHPGPFGCITGTGDVHLDQLVL